MKISGFHGRLYQIKTDSRVKYSYLDRVALLVADPPQANCIIIYSPSGTFGTQHKSKQINKICF